MRGAWAAALFMTLGAWGPAWAAGGGISIRDVSLDPGGAVRLVVSADSGQAGGALDAGSFKVWESGRAVSPLTVAPLFETSLKAVSVALAMDVSGSMKGRPLEDAKAAARGFVSHLPPSVPVALISFAGSVRVWSGFTTDRGVVGKALDGLSAGGETALYDGVSLASSLLARQDGQKDLVAFTDGRDTVSRASLEQTVATAAQAGSSVSVVALNTPDYDAAAIDRLTSATHGQSLPVDHSGQLAEVFTQVARQISSQYVVSYKRPAGGPPELEIKVAVGEASASVSVLNPQAGAASPAGPAAAPAREPLKAPGPLSGPAALIFGLVASFVSMAVLAGLVLRPGRDSKGLQLLHRVVTRREKKLEEPGLGRSALARRAVALMDRLPKPQGLEEGLDRLLDQAGLPLRASEFLVLTLVSALSGFAIGFGLVGSPALGLLLLLGGIVLPRFVLKRRVERRSAAFLAQLPPTLQFISGSLQAGYAVVQALDMVAREFGSPTSDEFARVLAETRLGGPLEEALERMADRIGGEDFRWVVLAINIQRQVGGNLASLLDTVAGTLREREQIRRQVKVLAAEGKLSAIVLGLLPFLLGGYIALVNPGYVSELFTTGVGRFMITGGLGLMVLGIAWMRKIIRIEV